MCAGRGVCNYNNIDVNGTLQPKCECFDESDTSPGCSDSQIQSGDYLDDAGDLFDNIEEQFFDPLVAVFVDHPDKWTSASWAWGAGLLTVFLVMLLCICSTFWPEARGKKGFDLAKTHRGTDSSPRTRASSSSPRRRSSSMPQSRESRRASSNRDRASAKSRKHSSSSRRPEERRKGSSSSRPRSSRNSSSGPSVSRPSEKRRNPSSLHERYLRENRQVVQHSQHNHRSERQPQGRSQRRTYPSTMAEM